MPRPYTYHRPQSLEDALQLVAREGANTAVLAGGTRLNANLAGVDEVVDLQALGLDQVSHGEDAASLTNGRLSLGAMVRVQTIVEDEDAPQLLRQLARREGPNTFRQAGTIGGVIVAGDSESELLAALLVYNTEVTVRTAAGGHIMPLVDFLAELAMHLRNGILTGVSLETGGQTAHARVARTPQDSPIVAAVARRLPNGSALLALCGVAHIPVLVGPDNLDTLDPPADFRGSKEYRKEMARVLVKRVFEELKES